MNYFKLLFIILPILFVVSCSPNGESTRTEDATPLMVSAAISLTDALEDIKKVYQKNHNVAITFNLGGSGKLAQQIKHGAPSDVFISANQYWMDTLENEALIIEETRESVTRNRIVLISKRESNLSVSEMKDINNEKVKRIAIGNPASVPAGKYAKQTLKSLHLWESIEDRLVYAKDVRQVLTYVETGNAELGFVYASDALLSDEVQVVATAKPTTHDPIIYPAAVIAGTKQKEAAKTFVEFLKTEKAQEIFKKYGFKK